MRVPDCVRAEGDKSLRKVYFDKEVASATGFNTEEDQSKLNASTVDEYALMKKLLKIIIFAILVGFGVIWYSESQKRRTMIPLEFRGE